MFVALHLLKVGPLHFIILSMKTSYLLSTRRRHNAKLHSEFVKYFNAASALYRNVDIRNTNYISLKDTTKPIDN